MATDKMLFRVDTIVVDGAPIAFEDGTGVLTGAARWENAVVASATGDDFESRKRVATTFKCKLQFGPSVDPAVYAGMNGVQITARDLVTGRRALMPNCGFASMGDIGSGSVDVTFNVLAAIQWL